MINCAEYFGVDIIISLTSDNPLVEPKMITKMIKIFNKDKLDYFDNLNTSFTKRNSSEDS